MIRKLRSFLVVILLLTGNLLFSQSKDQLLLETKITASFSAQNLLEIFEQLERSYELRFFYKEEWIPRTPITLIFNEASLRQVLNTLLQDRKLAFAQYGEKAIIVGRESDLQILNQFSYEQYLTDIESPGQGIEEKGFVEIIGDSMIRPLPLTASIQGSIYDEETEIALVGAQIFFPQLNIGAFSDSEGNFSMKIPTGRYKAEIEAPGHEKLRIGVWVFSDGTWEIPLYYTAYQLTEVLLEAESVGQNRQSPEAGKVNISIVDIRKRPALLGEVDIVNTVLLLPGVTSVGEAATGFNVRGGNVDQNLLMLAGNPIYNSSHLFGLFSIFNPDIVQNATLYKGHIPAQYGGRISSVLDVKVKDGSYRKLRGKLSIGLLSSKLSLDGPIVKGKSSFVLGLRGAYPDVLTSYVVRIPEVFRSSTYYADASGKFTQKLGDDGKLTFFAYGSKDAFSFAEGFGFKWDNFSSSLEWNQLYNSQLSTNLELKTTHYLSTFSNENGAGGSSNETGIDNHSLKANVQYVPNNQHNFNFGLEANIYNVLDNVTEPLGPNSIVIPSRFNKDQGLEFALYANDNFDLNDYVRFSAGLRYGTFAALGPYDVVQYAEGADRTPSNATGVVSYEQGETLRRFHNLEPRVSLRVRFDETASIKASYNRVNQYLHLISNTASSTPIDIWQLSNTYFPAQRGDNYSLGFFKDFGAPELETSLEFFYRDMNGLVVTKNFAQLLGNPNIETEVLNATGYAYGGELSINRSFGDLELEFSITYARSFRKTVDNPEGITINQGEFFPADFDSPFNINLSAKWTQRDTRTFGLNFLYRTGRPVSAPRGVIPVFPNLLLPDFSERNSFRIPDYHRLDLSYTFDDGLIYKSRVKSDITFSLYNAYGRRNPFSVFFQKEGTQVRAFTLSVLGTIIPFVSYNVRF